MNLTSTDWLVLRWPRFRALRHAPARHALQPVPLTTPSVHQRIRSSVFAFTQSLYPNGVPEVLRFRQSINGLI